MKKVLAYVTAFSLVAVLAYAMFVNSYYKHELPVHTTGNYFRVEWLAPKDAVSYRGFITNDSLKMMCAPFACKELFRMPPVLKEGKKQFLEIRYTVTDEEYDLYVVIYAFDIYDNYWNVKLLNLEGFSR